MVHMEVQVVSTDEGGICRDCIGDVKIEICMSRRILPKVLISIFILFGRRTYLQPFEASTTGCFMEELAMSFFVIVTGAAFFFARLIAA
jgi:hypothetical protein